MKGVKFWETCLCLPVGMFLASISRKIALFLILLLHGSKEL